MRRGLLLLAHLEEVLALLDPRAAVLTRGVGTDLDRALGAVALGALEVELDLLATATLAVWAGVTSHVVLLSLILAGQPAQTRRRLGGRHTVVRHRGHVLRSTPTSRPAAVRERIAVSRPEPGPFTKTSTLRMPCSMARRAAASAAICAANGVDLREPLKPTWPAEDQAMTAPAGSVIETIVLLNVLLM